MYNDLLGTKLPKALSKSETMSYFKGSPFYTREDIINGNMRLVSSIVANYNVSSEDRKDLFQIGLIGLIKAVDSFNVLKGTQFSSYAIPCIQNEIGMYLRKFNKDSVVTSMEESIYTNKNGEDIRLEDSLVDEKANIEENYENKEVVNLLKELVVSLNIRDSFVVSLYFGLFDNEPINQYEIAFRLNISQSYVSRLVSGILTNLKELILNPPKKRKRRGKRGSSIFKLLKGYDRKLVWEVINELNEEDRILLYLRCGRDLNNPEPSPFWNENTAYKFNTILMPKMKRKLEEKMWDQENGFIEELSPKEKYRREKISEIHRLLISMDMVNAQISLHEYLLEVNLIQYENFIVSLIILSVMDQDFSFEIPIRNLILLEKGYIFNIQKYKDYFYQTLVNEFDEASLYLDIITCLYKNGMTDIKLEPLNKAYTRVLEQKNNLIK